VHAAYCWIKVGTDWTVPVVELRRGPAEQAAKGTAVLVADAGRRTAAADAERQNWTASQKPVEFFSFGLLEAFDVKQLAALIAPPPVTFVEASARPRQELAGLKDWYATLGKDFDPLR
jgi:hypothetical protein